MSTSRLSELTDRELNAAVAEKVMGIAWDKKRGTNRLDSSISRCDNQDLREEPPLSLCIAATCTFESVEDQCVIHCCDTAGTRGDVKSEDIDKIRNINGHTILLAGDMSQARALLAACTPFLERYRSGGDDIAITRLIEGLTEAVRIRKRAKATAVLSAEYGLTWDEAFNFSQAKPGPLWTEVWNLIKSLSLGAELIISTFTDDEAAILTIEATGKVTWADHYAAVGTGSQIASAFLHQREYRDHMSLDECLYRVLEAKTAAEKNPYVGKDTDIVIGTQQGKRWVGRDYRESLTAVIKKRREELPETNFEWKYITDTPFD